MNLTVFANVRFVITGQAERRSNNLLACFVLRNDQDKITQEIELLEVLGGSRDNLLEGVVDA